MTPYEQVHMDKFTLNFASVLRTWQSLSVHLATHFSLRLKRLCPACARPETGIASLITPALIDLPFLCLRPSPANYPDWP